MAREEADNAFVSVLDDKSKEKARKELHELNDKDRLIAVQTFRMWVLEQDWLKSPTDFEFLLRFMRTRKFSQLEARKTLENYWTCKTKMPRFYTDIDPANPDFQNVLKMGFMFGHKKLDEEGRRLLMVRPGCLTLGQLKDVGLTTIYRVYSLVLEWFMYDENTQVNGLNIVLDYTNMGWQQYLAYASFEEQKNLCQFLQKSLPIRLKGVYYYNEPAFFDMLLAFFGQFMTDKVRERMQIVGKNLVDLYKVIDKSLLPTEYLPDDYKGPNAGSLDTIIDGMIADMTQTKFYDYIREVSLPEYRVDVTKRADMEKEPAASFRKLNVE